VVPTALDERGSIVKGGTLCKAILPVGINPAHTKVTRMSKRNARVSRDVRIRAGTVADREKQATGGKYWERAATLFADFLSGREKAGVRGINGNFLLSSPRTSASPN
jgi:hypothetical protein